MPFGMVHKFLCERDQSTEFEKICVPASPATQVRMPPGFHTTARELQTCTFQGPGASNTTKIPREHSKREREREKSENGSGRGKKKREIVGPPPSGSHPSSPHAAGPHHSAPLPSSGGPPGLHFFCFWAPTFLILIMLLICSFLCIFKCFYFLSFFVVF